MICINVEISDAIVHLCVFFINRNFGNILHIIFNLYQFSTFFIMYSIINYVNTTKLTQKPDIPINLANLEADRAQYLSLSNISV